jgi:2-iminoacetate synthase ThiH
MPSFLTPEASECRGKRPSSLPPEAGECGGGGESLEAHILAGAGLDDLATPVRAGQRLPAAAVERLCQTSALHALRLLAAACKERLHGPAVYRLPGPAGPGQVAIAPDQATAAVLLGLRDRHHAQVVIRDPDRAATALELLRAVACVRLVADDVPHVAVSAADLPPALAELALDFGADQLVGAGGPKEAGR